MQYIRGNHEVNQVSPDCGLQKGHLGYCSSLGKEKQRHKHEQMRLNFPTSLCNAGLESDQDCIRETKGILFIEKSTSTVCTAKLYI